MKRVKSEKCLKKIRTFYVWVWESILGKFPITPSVRYYSFKVKKLQRRREFKQALQLLQEAVESHPLDIRFHTDLALAYMEEKQWKEANKHWEVILRYSEKEINPAFFADFGRSLRRENKLDRAQKILEKGLSIYPKDSNILFERAEIARRKKEWKTSIKYLQKSFVTYEGTPPIKFYLRKALSYQKSDNLSQASVILKKGVDVYPDSPRISIEYAMIAIIGRNWKEANKRLENLIERFDKKVPLEERLKWAIVNQIIGNYDKANEVFTKTFENLKEQSKLKEKNDFFKIVLFDNGESRIEFYKKFHSTNTVVVTFDSINIQWDEKPFGFNFLLKENVDIIAVRRRKNDSYQQDLSIDDFYDAVNVLADYYTRKVSYGFSLGAYSALYFGSSINSEILSLSPRNSTHPMHEEKLISGYKFKHDLSHKVNANISPVIAFDPKNSTDREYVEKELKKSYPNGIFLEFPYSGHRIAPFFLQIGILKDIVQRVIKGEKIPNYKNVSRCKSHQYLRVLGNACLRRNKNNWALKLGKRAVEIAPEDVQANILKISALTYLGKNEKAIKAAETANELIIDNEPLRLLLIKLYKENNYIIKAKLLVAECLDHFIQSEEFKSIFQELNEL